jgi:hypothetical protein
MPKVAMFLLAFLILVLNSAQFVHGDDNLNSEKCSSVESTIEKKVVDFHARISYADDGTCQRLQILKKNKIVYSEEGNDNHYTFGNDWDGHHDPYLMHLIGRGTQLIISKWTGGAHCCNSLLIFDVQGEFRKIGDIYGGNYNFEIVDLNHDGIPEIRLTDDFLAYRFSSFAYSAGATVVLKYSNLHYWVAPELMKSSAHLESFYAKIPKWRKLLRKRDNPDWPPPSFIQAMTDLIFTGNETLAFQMVDKVWVQKISGKDDFLKSYRKALADSRYYKEFKRRN